MTKLVGDYNFFMTVLKHGIFDSTSRRQFLLALQKEREAAMASSVDAHHAGDEGSPTKRARVENDALRRAALHARLAYRKGARLAQRMKEDNSIYASHAKTPTYYTNTSASKETHTKTATLYNLQL